jgi:hypothetical protein
MGKVKSWLMEMESDAMSMSKTSFTKKHGEMQADIWHKFNDVGIGQGFIAKEEFISKEEREQAMAEVALDLEIAAEEGR